jgi:hypothetical protein
MIWSEVDFSKILVNVKRKIIYDDGPLRFQLPETVCTDGLSEYNQMTIEVPIDFSNWYSELEQAIGIIHPWKTLVNDGFMTLKIDDSSQIFDSNKKLTQSKDFQGCTIKCILEVSGVYFFRETYGLTCRIYQIMSSTPQCLFLSE